MRGMVLNIAAYHFLAIDDPRALADTLHARAAASGMFCLNRRAANEMTTKVRAMTWPSTEIAA